MPASYSFKIIYKQAGMESELKSEVNNDAEGKVLRMIVTIKSEYIKNNSDHVKDYKGWRASVEFCDNGKIIDNIGVIMKDQRIWRLILFYEKEIFEATSSEQLLLNDTRIAQQGENSSTQKANLLPELIRIIFSTSGSKIKGTATADILFLLKFILQKLSVYTCIKVPNQEEVTIAKTYLGFRNLTLLDRKFANTLFHLHLANVILANQLILKPTTDLITGFEKAISLLQRRAIPYSFGITAVNLGFNAYFNIYDKIRIPNNQNLFIDVLFSLLPVIWPILGFCVRKYGRKIVSSIVRYAINRILNSPNYKNSFTTGLDLNV